MDRCDAVDYGFEVEADPLYSYELDPRSHSHSPTQKVNPCSQPITHTLERCTTPLHTDIDNPPGPPTPHTPTEAQRYAAAHRTSIDTHSNRQSVAQSRSNSYDWNADDDETDEGIIWFGKREAPCAERIELFQNWVGVALDPNAPEEPNGKKNPQLMRRLVGAWRQRRRRRSSKE